MLLVLLPGGTQSQVSAESRGDKTPWCSGILPWVILC